MSSMHEDPGGYADTGWWRTYYTGIALDFWQSLLPAERAVRDADFLQAAFRLPLGSKILDVPCGEGRVALELASRGFDVVGVDISTGLLKEAAQRASLRDLSLTWHEGDMRHLPWLGEFDAAFCWGDSFGYMDEEGNQAFLASVWQALKPGGRWAMEMGMVAEVLYTRYREELDRDVGGIHVHIRRSFNPRLGRLTVDYTLNRAGTVEQHQASYRIYSCSEICRMLERAGFTIDQLHGGADAPFQIGSERLCLVATR